MNNKIPPPLVTLFFGLCIFFTKSFFPEFNSVFLNVTSLLLLLVGISILVSAVSSFKVYKTTINPIKIENASTLVTAKSFSLSRNPMYLGMLIILMSLSFKFNIIGGLFILPLFVFFITKFQIIPEEVAMEKIFKDEFVKYKATTRRWI